MLSQLMSWEAPQKDQSPTFWSNSWLLVDVESVWDSLGTLQKKTIQIDGISLVLGTEAYHNEGKIPGSSKFQN